jgi:hypothetical protein
MDAAQDLRPITWLASYPRSGNTLLRLILKTCFGLSSQSIYGDREFDDPLVSAMVGHEAVGEDPQAFVRAAQRQARSLYVKTHELPGADSHPAICVVRDGRSALVSHWHYLREILQRDVTLLDVIAGRYGLGWSQQVQAWALSGRDHTLVLHYEALAAGDAKTLHSLADFIGKPQAQRFDISFARLHGLYPAFFRRGSDTANIAEMDAAAHRLFDSLHGDTLRRLGYGAS